MSRATLYIAASTMSIILNGTFVTCRGRADPGHGTINPSCRGLGWFTVESSGSPILPVLFGAYSRLMATT